MSLILSRAIVALLLSIGICLAISHLPTMCNYVTMLAAPFWSTVIPWIANTLRDIL